MLWLLTTKIFSKSVCIKFFEGWTACPCYWERLERARQNRWWTSPARRISKANWVRVRRYVSNWLVDKIIPGLRLDMVRFLNKYFIHAQIPACLSYYIEMKLITITMFEDCYAPFAFCYVLNIHFIHILLQPVKPVYFFFFFLLYYLIFSPPLCACKCGNLYYK